MSPRLPIAAATLALAVACPRAGIDTAEPVPDFSLEDSNTSSATYGQQVAPSDFRGMASVWYFGHGS